MSRKTRRLIWSAPLVAVFAVVGALAAFGVLGLGGVAANELPNSPQNLMVKSADGNSGRTNLVLTWEAPAAGAPDMYRIDASSNGDRWSPEAEVSGSTLTYTDDLSTAVDSAIDASDEAPVNVTRYYRVFAMNSHGSGQVSTTESASTKNVSTPGAVDAFSANVRGPEMIELTWTVPDDGGSDILGYCVLAWSMEAGDTGTIGTVEDENCKDLFFSAGPGSRDATANDNTTGLVIRATPGSSYMHKKLRAGQTWNYTAYALNKYGQSMTASNTRQVKTASANVPPMPGNLLISQMDDASDVMVKLYWTVSGDGGQNISAYRVEVTDTPNNWPPDGTALGAQTTTVRGSTAALDYPTGATSGKQVAVINVNPAVAATSPVSHNLDHTVTIANGDIPSTVYYRVRVETGSGGGAKMSAYTEGSIKITDIADPNSYAHSANNPNAPTVTADPGGTDDDTVPGEIKLTVAKSTLGGSSDYRVDISDDGGDTWTMVHRSTRPINETEYQHQGLDPDKTRQFRLFTKNGSNFGLASDVAEDISGQSKAPDRVESLRAVKNGAGEVKVSWTAPLKDNGAMVDKYCVVMKQIDDDNTLVGTPDVMRASIRVIAASANAGDEANCTRYGLPDLYPGKASINGSNRVIDVDADLTMVTVKVGQETRWQFQVYALNGATAASVPTLTPDTKKGLSTVSETVHDKTTAGMKPNMPRDLTAELARDTNLSGVGNRGVLLLWNQPAGVPGAAVNSYKIERSTDGGDYEVLVSSLAATRTYYVDTSEPAADEMRTYRVTAINIAGSGMEMATVMIPYPPEHTTHPPASAALMAVSDLSAMPRSTTGTAEVSWTPGNNATMHWIYAIRADEMEGGYTFMQTSSNSSHPLTGLDSSVEYIVGVSAGKGQLPGGEWSAWMFTRVTPN